MNRRTKALSISQTTRKRVMERDNGQCVLCGRTDRLQCAHYIGRGQGGLGIPENLVMLCSECHREYDQSAERDEIRAELREYLRGCCADWDERELIYRKELS